MSFPEWLGYVSMGVTIAGFGTCMVPVKKFEMGDGFFFQWVMCISIFLWGLIVDAARGNPPIDGLSIIGGILWAFGNSTAVSIIRVVGVGIGMTTWGATTMIVGWLTGTFGLFGLKKQEVSVLWLSIVGVCFTMASIGALVFVDPKGKEKEDAKKGRTVGSTSSSSPAHELSLPAVTPSSGESSSVGGDSSSYNVNELSASSSSNPPSSPRPSSPSEGAGLPPASSSVNLLAAAESAVSPELVEVVTEAPLTRFLDGLSPKMKKVAGFGTSIGAGLLYGSHFTPTQWVIDNVEGSSQVGLDYLHSQFIGILIGSTLVFMIYCAIMKNRPQMNKEVVLPSMLSGFLWTLAQTGWFIANSTLSMVISFPIVLVSIGLVAIMIGFIFFKENRGLKNVKIIAASFLLAVVSTVLTILSRVL